MGRSCLDAQFGSQFGRVRYGQGSTHYSAISILTQNNNKMTF